MSERLFDANAVVDIFLGETGVSTDTPFTVLFDAHILDLTVYEAGNALWKVGVALDELTDDDLHEAVALLASLPEETAVETVTGPELVDVMNTAQDEGLTVYDASYLFVAQRDELALVTEDSALRGAAGRNGVTVEAVTDLA